ncbi:MAG: hypothetical protein N2572_00130 [Syntrophales bacterium]|nr:hypothetical protein [Syntrophales bacterium]
MPDLAKRLLLAGAGLVFFTADKMRETIDELVKRGELTEQEARETIEEISRNWEAKMEELISKILTRLNLPSRKELEELKERVKNLEHSLAKTTDAPPQA